MPASLGPSAAVLTANARLATLREHHQQNSHGHTFTPPLPDAVATGSLSDLESLARALPRHLGWGSVPLTAVLRQRQPEPRGEAGGSGLASTPSPTFDWPAGTATTREETAQITPHLLRRSVKLYPDIGLGMLRQEMTAPGRLWMMLRFLDQEGRGVLRIDILVDILTKKSSNLRLCGKRQLRNLFNDGEDVFWHRDKARVWLHSAARVAYALEIEGLTGRPVALPVAALVEGIGTFRAHLYAAFHSGRLKETPNGRRVMPIARDTLAGLSGVGRSSQRAYEDRVGVAVQANFSVGEVATKENQEKRAWAHGQALFELKDYRGQQGKKGKTYLAWQLPNSYSGQHQHRPKGRQKRINRKLKDLVMKGMPGNVEGTNEAQKPEKLYFPNGKLAAKAYGRDAERELYWRRHRTGNGRFEVWHQLGDR